MKKNIFLTLIFLFAIISPCSAIVAGDFDGNDLIDMRDIAYFMAWFLKGGTQNKGTVITTAESLYANAKGPIVRLPDPAYDNFYGDSTVNMKDIAIMMAFFLKGGSTDFNTVRLQAISLYANANNVYKLPATKIGDSVIDLTVTGIETDP